MEIIAFLMIVVFAIIVFVVVKTKNEEIKKEGFPSIGEVTGFGKKFVKVAGTWTWLDCPKVRYLSKNGETKVDFIKNAKGGNTQWQVGQKVDIIIYKGIIYSKNIL